MFDIKKRILFCRTYCFFRINVVLGNVKRCRYIGDRDWSLKKDRIFYVYSGLIEIQERLDGAVCIWTDVCRFMKNQTRKKNQLIQMTPHCLNSPCLQINAAVGSSSGLDDNTCSCSPNSGLAAQTLRCVQSTQSTVDRARRLTSQIKIIEVSFNRFLFLFQFGVGVGGIKKWTFVLQC